MFRVLLESGASLNIYWALIINISWKWNIFITFINRKTASCPVTNLVEVLLLTEKQRWRLFLGKFHPWFLLKHFMYFWHCMHVHFNVMLFITHNLCSCCDIFRVSFVEFSEMNCQMHESTKCTFTPAVILWEFTGHVQTTLQTKNVFRSSSSDKHPLKSDFVSNKYKLLKQDFLWLFWGEHIYHVLAALRVAS